MTKLDTQKAKIDQIVELVKLHKIIRSTVLAEKIYGDASPENVLKLQSLISACRHKGKKSMNIYCIRGYYVDISVIFNAGSQQ